MSATTGGSAFSVESAYSRARFSLRFFLGVVAGSGDSGNLDEEATGSAGECMSLPMRFDAPLLEEALEER